MPADLSNFFQTLIGNLGGNTVHSNAAKIDPQTGEILSPASETAKHPWMAKASGKQRDIDKLNEMMQILQSQTNSKIGQSRLQHTQEEDTANNDVNRRRLDETHQPSNKNTRTMLDEMQANPEVIKALQTATNARAGADQATAGQVTSQANLGKKQADTQLDNFNPDTFMGDLRAQMAKSLGVTLNTGDIYGQVNPDGTITKRGQGSTMSEVPGATIPMKMPDGSTIQYPVGQPMRTMTPGNFNGNIKSLLDKSPTGGIGAGSVLDGSVLTQGVAPAVNADPFIGGFGNMPQGATRSASSPQALGLNPATNYGRALSGQDALLELLSKLGRGAVSTLPASAMGGR